MLPFRSSIALLCVAALGATTVASGWVKKALVMLH
jgi:hypothetical protein